MFVDMLMISVNCEHKVECFVVNYSWTSYCVIKYAGVGFYQTSYICLQTTADHITVNASVNEI